MKKMQLSFLLIILLSLNAYAGPRTYDSCAKQLFSCADGTQSRQETSKTLRNCIQQFRGCYLSLKINEHKAKKKTQKK